MLRIRLGRVIASAILACATTVAVAWGLALWAPIARGYGTVSLDGDHLQPWILHVYRPGAERFIYFEKGRVYSRANVGPASASSSAVACWSFATATRNNRMFKRGSISLPLHLEAEMAKRPATAWGIAEDKRGWPFLAFACTIVGTTATDSLHVYTLRHGVRIKPGPIKANWGGPGPLTRVESLADIRVLPTRPLADGFVLNTLFAVVGWYGVLTAGAWLFAKARARLWRPVGHCPKCNYDLKGDLAAGCPECGWNREVKTPDNDPATP